MASRVVGYNIGLPSAHLDDIVYSSLWYDVLTEVVDTNIHEFHCIKCASASLRVPRSVTALSMEGKSAATDDITACQCGDI